jgi:hypothetical protein
MKSARKQTTSIATLQKQALDFRSDIFKQTPQQVSFPFQLNSSYF